VLRKDTAVDQTEDTPHAGEHRVDVSRKVRGDDQRSSTERKLRRLIVPEPAAYDPGTRLDVIHDPDLNLLWGAQE
jgi:hypothetical protein